MAAQNSLSKIFKAYDVRGIVPDEIDAVAARAIGAGFARFVAAETGAPRPEILLGHDVRESAAELSAAFISGAIGRGAIVTSLGLASTDLVYYASGKLNSAAVMLTASHNPAQYNGMKFCLPGAKPIGEESGLRDVLRYAEEEFGSSSPVMPPLALGADLLDDFADHVRSFITVDALRPFVIVADTANGMGGLIAPKVFSTLPVELHVLFGELDGTFPNHPADPIQPENLTSLISAIAEHHADIGLAFDGDADRVVFLVDELGDPLPGSTTTAIVAAAMLERHPGATILYNCICSHAVRETISERGGIGIRTRVGHSFIKQVMSETGAVFGGEHSGHYYFKENYRADSGIIAAIVVLDVLSETGGTLSELRAPFERYAASGEINTTVDDQAAVIDRIEEHYAGEAETDRFDGLTVDCGGWWFNLRPSNTEPLLRLNVEAANPAEVARRVGEVQALMGAS